MKNNATLKSTLSFVNLIEAGLSGILVLGIYYSTITWLVTRDWSRSDFNYCYLVPLLVLYLIWEKRAKLAHMASIPSWKGLIPLIAGLALFWLGELGGEYFTLYISLWLVLVGLCWIHLGWQKIKVMAFALFLALSMFPLPNFLFGKISLKFKLISSQLGVAMIRLWSIPAFREGNIIDLGSIQLQVVDACSGLRYLIPLIMLGFLLAYFFKDSLWKRAIVVISTVPLAIVVNGIRIGMTGVLCETWNPKLAEGFFHDFSGWFIFMLSLGILMVEIKILSRIKPRKKNPQPYEPPSTPFDKLTEPQVGAHHPSYLQPLFIISLIFLGVTLVASQGVNFRDNIPVKKSLSQFPLQVGEWTGVHQKMDQETLEALNLSDYVMMDYHNPAGKSINFYIAYYESQRKGESIHSPETCLPGSGWLFVKSKPVSLATPGYYGGSMNVNRALMQKLGYRQISYYWFLQRGRILTNVYQLKIYAFWDALTMHRTDGALVRVITPVYESEEAGDADARMQRFIQKIMPSIAEYMPGKEFKK